MSLIPPDTDAYPPQEKPAPGTEARAQEFWILVACILPSSMAFISQNALNVALPALQEDLSVTGSGLLWIINAYSLMLSALILVGGSLGDHYGRKRIFMGGIVLFTAGSIACGLAPSTGFLIVMRAVQGIGGALMVPGSLAILTALFPADRRGRAIGTWSTFSAVTTVMGPIIGGWLAGIGLWRAVFFINVPLGIISLFVLSRSVPETRDEEGPGKLDYMGAALITLALAALSYGFIQASEYGFSDLRIIVALAGGALLLPAFVLFEHRSDHPMVPLGLFRSRVFSVTNAMTLFLYAALGVVLFFVPLNLIQVQGYSSQAAGFMLLPFGLLLAALGRWSGGLVDRVGPRLPLSIGPALTGVGFLLFAIPGVTDGISDYWWSFLPPSIVIGLGMGITVAPLTTTVMGAAPQHSSGTASGINNAISRLANVFAIAIVGALALIVFVASMTGSADDLRLTPAARDGVEREAGKLGDARIPDELRADVASGVTNPFVPVLVEAQFKASFVTAFRVVAAVGAGLAWVSAALVLLFIGPRAHLSGRKGDESGEGDPVPDAA